MLSPVTLDEFYEAVGSLSASLSEADRWDDAEVLEDAVRGGSTSGEILTNVGVVLDRLREQVPNLTTEIEPMLAFINDALRPRW
ncbi:MAG: hypothetical protein QOH79_3836 [Acidimicrobiaceae bacterium]|jgi:hypothetical protein